MKKITFKGLPIMSAQLSFKSVLEHLYKKDAELVNKMITELETNKPAKKTMTQDEKDERKGSPNTRTHISRSSLRIWVEKLV